MEYYYIICHLNYIILYSSKCNIYHISYLQQLSGEHVCTYTKASHLHQVMLGNFLFIFGNSNSIIIPT